MSAEAREFVDTNILVYAFDASAGPRHMAAAALVERLWDSGAGQLSVQVLQEFFVTVTRKVSLPLSVDEAVERIRELSRWTVFAPGADDVLAAIALQQRAQLSFWDAMIVHAAAETRSDILWSEDLSDRQVVQGVAIRNPFTAEQA